MAVKVRERGDAWWVFVDHKGVRRAKKVGSKRAAEEVKKRLDREIALGSFNLSHSQAPTLAEYADTWVSQMTPHWRPSTKARYEFAVGNHIIPYLGQKRLNDLSRQDIKGWTATLQKAGTSAHATRYAVSVLRGCLAHAVEDEVITANPVQNLTKSIPKPPSGRVSDWLQPHELRAMLSATQARYSQHYEILALLSFTGMRVGEALGLRWGDIDFAGKFIMVRRSHSAYGTQKPKNGKPRRVDLSTELVDVLRKLRAERAKYALKSGTGEIPETVFVNNDAEPISGGYLRRVFANILKHAGLRHVRIHDLRHSFASNLLQAGVPIQYVQEQLGHSTITMTVDTYGHLLPGGHQHMLDQYHQNVLSEQLSATDPQPGQDTQPWSSYK